jgi:hypothetical protein
LRTSLLQSPCFALSGLFAWILQRCQFDGVERPRARDAIQTYSDDETTTDRTAGIAEFSMFAAVAMLVVGVAA